MGNRAPTSRAAPANSATMNPMKHHRPVFPALLLAAAALFAASRAAAQSLPTGTIEFLASARPADARPEPIRSMSFYLLRKSLADIRTEAEQSVTTTSMDQYIAGLKVSPELKAWMTKNHMVDFEGEKFTKALTPDDIVGIPEFFDAYTKENGANLGGGIPVPGYNEKMQKKDPEKYQRLHDQYKKLLRRYIAANPDTLDGFDIMFREVNPGPAWAILHDGEQQRIERGALQLAQTKYVVAETDSDLDGHGQFTNVAPGTYWISTLDTPALAGDARLQWNVTVNVSAGQTARVELSNLNALESTNRTAP
jgi:hypothetical protein